MAVGLSSRVGVIPDAPMKSAGCAGKIEDDGFGAVGGVAIGLATRSPS
jgi:hypothetical protein